MIDAVGNRQQRDCVRVCVSLSCRCRKVQPHTYTRTHAPLAVAMATPWQRAGVLAGSVAADLAYAKEERKKNRRGPSCASRSVLLPIISVLSRLRATRPEAALVSQGTVACCLAAEFGRNGAAGSSRCCSPSMQLLLLSWRCSYTGETLMCVLVSACASACECECKYYESNGCVKHVNFPLFPKSTLSKRDLCVYEVSLCALSISSTHHMSACTSARDCLIQDKLI